MENKSYAESGDVIALVGMYIGDDCITGANEIVGEEGLVEVVLNAGGTSVTRRLSAVFLQAVTTPAPITEGTTGKDAESLTFNRVLSNGLIAALTKVFIDYEVRKIWRQPALQVIETKLDNLETRAVDGAFGKDAQEMTVRDYMNLVVPKADGDAV